MPWLLSWDAWAGTAASCMHVQRTCYAPSFALVMLSACQCLACMRNLQVISTSMSLHGGPSQIWQQQGQAVLCAQQDSQNCA